MSWGRLSSLLSVCALCSCLAALARCVLAPRWPTFWACVDVGYLVFLYLGTKQVDPRLAFVALNHRTSRKRPATETSNKVPGLRESELLAEHLMLGDERGGVGREEKSGTNRRRGDSENGSKCYQ